jgi:hypothetical protein
MGSPAGSRRLGGHPGRELAAGHAHRRHEAGAPVQGGDETFGEGLGLKREAVEGEVGGAELADLNRRGVAIEEIEQFIEAALVVGEVRREHHRLAAEADGLGHAHAAPYARHLGAKGAVEEFGFADEDQAYGDILPALPLDLDGEAGDVYTGDTHRAASG